MEQNNPQSQNNLQEEPKGRPVIKFGQSLMAGLNFNDITNDLIKSCDVLEKTDEYVIIDLRECNL